MGYSSLNKILLIQPNTVWFGLRYWYTFPYTLALLYACLKEKYEVTILDANISNLSFDDVRNAILQIKPDIVGITCMSLEYDKCFKKIAEITKSVDDEILVVVGGIYPTLLPENLLNNENIDYAIMGEGELRLDKLIQYLNNNCSLDDIDGIAYRKKGNVVIQPTTTYIDDLDNLPFPDYTKIDAYIYFNKAAPYAYFTYPQRFPYAFIISSRGCPFNCVYCSSKKINGKKIRYRSAESLIKEIEQLITKYGIKEIIFIDDNIYLDKRRIMKFMKLLIEKKFDLQWKSINAAVYALDDDVLEMMRKSGCYQIALAIESGTEKGLRLMKKPYHDLSIVKRVVKKAKSLGFELGGLFIIGIPGETWEDIRATLKFAEDLNLDQISINIATPLPCTELYYESKRNGYLPDDFSFNDLDFYGFGNPVISTDEFIPEELKILRSFEWDRINFKTEEKKRKIAKMTGITKKDVEEWRKVTRRNLGINVKFKNH